MVIHATLGMLVGKLSSNPGKIFMVKAVSIDLLRIRGAGFLLVNHLTPAGQVSTTM